MGRKKIDNALSEMVFTRLDKNLAKELREYADRNDNGMPSVSARKFIEKCLKEITSQEV